jgi:hypothetical protein
VPTVYPTGLRATWRKSSGIPSKAEISFARARLIVVDADPKPRARNASMKLQAA